MLDLRQGQFIALLGGAAAAWPLAARAQQPAVPIMGYLDSRSPEAVANRLRGLRQGLKESGYIENENLAIAYRWAENQPDRLNELAPDLAHRRVAAIVSAGFANGEGLVVEVPRYVLERLLVRAKRAIEAVPLLARGRSTGHSARSRNK